MKILLLCNKSPYPAIEGGSMAMDAMIRGLLMEGHHLHVLAVDSEKFPAAELPPELRDENDLVFQTAKVDLKIYPIDALFSLLKGTSYHVSRFKSAAFTKALLNILDRNKFDIVQFETPFLGQYLPLVKEKSDAKIVLRAHNIESRVWQRLAEGEASLLKRKYLESLSRALYRFESGFTAACDGIISITERDAEWFRNYATGKVLAFPFGLDLEEERMDFSLNDQLFHIGSMNWLPNEEGIRWFLDEVWPLVLSQDHGLRLHLAGRKMPQWVLKKNWEGVVVHGEVISSTEFMRNYGIMIVPLLSGSGMRIKIVEGMKEGRAIVSTAIGAEGIEYTEGKDLLIANDAAEFAEAILRLTTDPHMRKELGENASQLLRESYNLRKIMPVLSSYYQRLLNEG